MGHLTKTDSFYVELESTFAQYSLINTLIMQENRQWRWTLWILGWTSEKYEPTTNKFSTSAQRKYRLNFNNRNRIQDYLEIRIPEAYLKKGLRQSLTYRGKPSGFSMASQDILNRCGAELCQSDTRAMLVSIWTKKRGSGLDWLQM